MEHKNEIVIARTESLCPECLIRLPAERVMVDNTVVLRKHCPQHGSFEAVMWKGALPPSYSDHSEAPAQRPLYYIPEQPQGCPYDCGLCGNHRQHTCAALLEVTQRCNLHCPVCFAGSSAHHTQYEPDRATVEQWYDQVMTASGDCMIQLSGGEPTVRDDLCDIIIAGRKKGFSFIQVNTNGLRLSEEQGYAEHLKDAGLASVFLQFDGTDDDIYYTLRGRPLLDMKRKAIENCARAGLGVVLVPTVVPGVNDHTIGSILCEALRYAPAVRGVHFQPISYFGRYPCAPHNRMRITLPEIIAAIESQTGGRFSQRDLLSPAANCEHALCSFHGTFVLMPDGTPMPVGQSGGCCSNQDASSDSGARKTIISLSRKWGSPPERSCCSCTSSPFDLGSRPSELDMFLERARSYTFSISGMAFQDVWTIDLERLKFCCIHVVAPDGRLVPFCAYNLTSSSGQPLHRKIV